MTADETMLACGGEAKCGGDSPSFRYTILGEAVLWREAKGQPLRARTVQGKFLRGDRATALMRD